MRYSIEVLIGNGQKFPSRQYQEIFKYYLKNFPVIAVDGGANYCRENKIFPEKIIGDMDSITKETEKFFLKKNINFQKIKDQSSTDLEKALQYSDAENFFCFGFTGRYFDHEISLLHILQKNFFGGYGNNTAQKNIFIFTENQVFFVLPKSGKVDFKNVGVPLVGTLGKQGNHKGLPLQNEKHSHKISFYPLTPTTFTSSSGLKYPLNGLTLAQGKIIGTSNQTTQEKISWEIEQGCCLGFFPIEFASQISHDLYDISLD